ncbi:flagellar protein FlgN [Geobacillus thermoleovorans]|uniref:flagellar protein FlgN n=1 Tax=Geobacillus thermoleovorans group TaxID=1505648 RepID=UPI0005CDB170|nr:flagellar protein FlgN [Geobacillus kaustophilus]
MNPKLKNDGQCASARQLVALLERHLALHRHLLQLAYQKTDVLKRGDTDGLMQLIQTEQTAIAAIQQLERERAQLVAAWSDDGNPPSLADCLPKMGEERDTVEQLASELLVVIRELQDVNEMNGQLIRQSLQWVTFMLDRFMPQPPSVNYTAPNQSTGQYERGRSLFDSKA